MKVVVTGGAGFIGSHVIDALCSKGAKVICIDSLDPDIYHAPPTYLRSDVDYCFVDLRHWQPDARFEDVEAIVHLAALGGVSRASREPANILGANVLGTARLVAAARHWPKLRKIVHASSFSVYGSNYTYRVPSTGKLINGDRRAEDLLRGLFEVMDPHTGEVAEILPITEEAAPNPLETYGASKYMQELCYRGFDRSSVTLLRFSSVYGTRLRLDDGEATIIARLAGWIKAGEPPKIFEDGQQARDWVYIGDLVDAILALVMGVEAPAVINICSGTQTTLVDACEILQKVLNVRCAPDIVGGFRPGDMRHCVGDPIHFSRLLGRDPLSFSDGAILAFGS